MDFQQLLNLVKGNLGGQGMQQAEDGSMVNAGYYNETPDNRITNRLVDQGRLPQAQREVYPQTPNNFGTYSEDGINSIGGSVNLPFGLPQVGGVLGVDNGVPFGGMNVNHKPVAQFGPGDSELVDVGGRPQNQMQPDPIISAIRRLLGQ